MPTQIPTVKVSRTERGGHLITCSACPRFRTMRTHRVDADAAAARHQRDHVKPDPFAALDDEED